MSASVNKAIIIGNLGADPEIRATSIGSKLARFPVATNDRSKDKEGNTIDKTEWHKVVVFGKKADIAEQYLKKGSLVAIEGTVRNNKWTDNDGNERESVEIHITQFRGEFTMLGSRNEGGSSFDDSNTQDGSASQGNDGVPPDMDDIPF